MEIFLWVLGYIAFIVLGYPVYCIINDFFNTRRMMREEEFRRRYRSGRQ